MEHEQRIREKVLMAEESLSTWNKEFVWSAIPHTKEPKRPMAFYYAAASVALAAAIVFYSLETTQQQMLQVQLSGMELAIEHAQQSRLTTATATPQMLVEKECDNPIDNEIVPTPMRRASRKILSPSTVASIIPDAVAQQSTPEELPLAATIDQVPLTEPPATPPTTANIPEAPVRPIIGSFLSVATNIESKADQRLQLRLFRSDEGAKTMSSSTPTTNLAGINNQ